MMVAGGTRRFYNRIARVYDLAFDKVFRPGRIASIRSMGIKPGDRVLEVGVGTGLNLPLYPPLARVVGIDLSQQMLEVAVRRSRRSRTGATIALTRMNACELAFDDDSFDHVYASYVISVVGRPRRVVEEMCRVCRPGGKLIIVNHFESRHRLGSSVERALSPLTVNVGFRLDLPLEAILDVPRLEMVDRREVNLLKLWSLLVFEKRPA